MARRRFNGSERVALYLAAGGKCAQCGDELAPGWHADHVAPWSAGGATDVTNGQALCPKCNLKKGNQMDEGFRDAIEYRPWQQRLQDATLAMVAQKRKLLVADVYCGSGKTLGYLSAGNMLHRMELIDSVLILTPRTNLCRQIHFAWRDEFRALCAEPRMGNIAHRMNQPPILRPDAQGVYDYGYTTTYASLVSNPGLHLDFFRNRRVLLVLDEAQQLGLDARYGEDTTKSAEVVDRMFSQARYVLPCTGTAYRADRQQILYGQYSDPDPITGARFLQADVRATYLEGVAGEYLRPFDYTLCDGRATYQYLDETTDEVVLSEMRQGLHKVLEGQGYWAPFVDRFVEKVRQQQTVHPRFCGLIAALNTTQAREVMSYLARRHKGFRALIAISKDGDSAVENLEQFKQGGWDALITVRMAYVGYDYKWINVVAMLSDYRWYGFLDQLFARGERMLPFSLVPRDLQVLHAIVPNDPRMSQYVEAKRKESERGLLERKKDGPPPPPPRLGWTEESELTTERAQGMNAIGDLAPSELAVVRQVQHDHDLESVPATKLAAAFRSMGVEFTERPSATSAEVSPQPSKNGKRPVSTDEEEAILRRRLDRVAKQCDGYMRDHGQPERPWGQTAGMCNDAFTPYKLFKQCGLGELRLKQKWLADYVSKLPGDGLKTEEARALRDTTR